MSNIYIKEPPTFGKVLLKTNFGEIDVELWARETPKACRNFVQLCLEGFYNNVIFHRVIKNFIAQTGDPTGTGTCNDSIYGAPFKDEIHSRLRFNRRGLVALANSEKNDNGCQFFFTLDSTPSLQGKHTIFGTIVGDTIFTLLKLNDILVDKDNRPVYEQKIISVTVLNNPFNDIVPRVTVTEKEIKEDVKKTEKGVKNFQLLSFGEEAEEDEAETSIENHKFVGKSKSIHDVLNDPKLSSKSIVDNKFEDDRSESDENEEVQSETVKTNLENIRNKFKKESLKIEKQKLTESDDTPDMLSKEKDTDKNRRLKEIKDEIKNLKREYQQQKKERIIKEETKEKEETKNKENTEKNELYEDYVEEQKKYKLLKEKIPKGSLRDDVSFSVMQKFKERLQSIRNDSSLNQNEDEDKRNTCKSEKSSDLSWKNQVECNSTEVIAKDANTKTDDWYEIYDPRNPITKRRREMSHTQLSEKRKRKKYDL